MIARHPIVFCSVALALLGALQGCSLITIKSPAIPLSPRELNARMMTREYAQYFQKSIARTADDITAQNSDPDVQLAALRWKLSAAFSSRRAATQMSAMMGLLDTWALAAQMREFLTSGAGSALFGPQQAMARTTAAALEEDIVAIAREIYLPRDFARSQMFVADYIRDAPSTSLEFVRVSVVDRWTAATGQKATLISTVGTVPEVMSDFADRLRLYGDELPEEALWQTQLALREEGYGAKDWQRAIAKINDSLSVVGRLAETTPELLHDSTSDLRSIMFSTADRFDRTWMGMLREMRVERESLAKNIQLERSSILSSVDAQRATMTRDAERIANEVIESLGHQLRALVREFALFAIAGIVVLFSLPFAAGYFLGRARRTS